MKKFLILLLVGFSLVGCKLIAKEMKRANQIRKVAKEACDCKYVGVSTSYSQGNATLTLTIKRTQSKDYAAIADSVMSHMIQNYEKTCGFGEITILFETDSLTERYKYYGCEPGAEHDQFDPNSLFGDDEWEEWDEWEEDSVEVETDPVI